MLSTNRLNILEAKESDIKTIMEMENHIENRNFVWKGTYEEHKAEILDSDFFLFIIKQKEDNAAVGFALIKIDKKSEVFELRRIVISEKGSGYGKEVVSELFRFAFEDLGMNRFWLDVYPDNLVGIKLYEKLGMKREGILRQNYKSERGFLDQIIYSMLKTEYFAIKNPR